MKIPNIETRLKVYLGLFFYMLFSMLLFQQTVDDMNLDLKIVYYVFMVSLGMEGGALITNWVIILYNYIKFKK